MWKYILLVLPFFTTTSNSFMITKSKSFELSKPHLSYPLYSRCASRCASFPVCMNKNSLPEHNDNKNKSKVYKLDFSDDDKFNDDWLFEPRYAFGLSEFNMIFIRIYVYMVITFNVILNMLHM